MTTTTTETADILDELTDLSGAPPHEVKAVADRAIKEIERLREKLGWMELAVSFYAKTQWWDQGRVARAALKEIE